METIRINFTDFWSHFQKTDNYFYHLLSRRFNIQICDNPDFLIYSSYGKEHLNYKCYRIFYNGENIRINWNACDFAFSFDYLNDIRHFRLPNWILYDDPQKLLTKKIFDNYFAKRKFCNMVVSNPHAKKRINFFHQLSKYKKVDSGGSYLNNINYSVKDKRHFIANYKFTLAFENSSYPGYTTEKIFEPMMASSIPIYWGNPFVGKDFNTASFVNLHDFRNEKQAIEFIKVLDCDDSLYMQMLNQPWYRNNKLPECVKEENILAQFEKIFSFKGKVKPVATSFKKHIYYINNFGERVDNTLNRYLKYRKRFR